MKTKANINYGSDQMIKDAGSLSFMTPLGTVDNVESVTNGYPGSWGAGYVNQAVAGITVVKYRMIPGKSVDGNSALNMAAKKLYSFVRHQNSGSRNYDSPDLMQYVYSVATTYAFIAECVRTYGILRKFEGKNKYIPKALCHALGFDYIDLENHISDFRAYINTQICKLSALKIPSNWLLLRKNWWLCSTVFKDGDIDRSQLYAFKIDQLWKYNESGTYIGSLTPELLIPQGSTDGLTFADIKYYFDTVINALVASEDINIMSGDILKAYGEDGCARVELIDENFIIEPIYDEAALEIMHNVTAYPLTASYTTTAGNIIRQDSTGALLHEPVIITTDLHWASAKTDYVYFPTGRLEYLDFNKDKVEPIDVVNGSSMTVIPNFNEMEVESGNVPSSITVDSAGTEWPLEVELFKFTKAQGVSGNEIICFRKMVGLLDSQNTNYLEAISRLTKCDWAPRVTYIYCYGSEESLSDDSKVVASAYDLYNYTVVGKNELRKLHDYHVLAALDLANNK